MEPGRRTAGVVPASMMAAMVAGVVLGCGSPVQDPSADPATSGGATSSGVPSASPPTPSPSAGEARDEAPGAAPELLRIPSLGLEESLIDLGLARDGTLEVPEDPARVGWFTGGGRPGGNGPTVLVGHVDSLDGPAVFAELPELVPGDEVVVGSEDGSEVRYVVEEATDVPQQPFPTEQVFGATPDDTLRLITCTGPYDREAGRYTENRIVTAVPA